MSILVTGFEPFGGSSRNASWEAVSLLPETIAGHAVYRMRLPVCYGQAGDLLVEMMRRIRPAVTLCCGVAGGRKAITPELIAVNYRRAAIADNADVLYAGEKIDPKRPDAHMTRLNVLRMVDAMKSAGLPADLSLTAGAYVCNDLYFALLDRRRRGRVRACSDGGCRFRRGCSEGAGDLSANGAGGIRKPVPFFSVKHCKH